MSETFRYGKDACFSVEVHEQGECEGHCAIHNPSDHPLRDRPLHWRAGRSLMERICPHGVGHPDPDHMARVERLKGKDFADAEGVHGCDGCCRVHRPAAVAA